MRAWSKFSSKESLANFLHKRNFLGLFGQQRGMNVGEGIELNFIIDVKKIFIQIQFFFHMHSNNAEGPSSFDYLRKMNL
jgi:hypothetical protein